MIIFKAKKKKMFDKNKLEIIAKLIYKVTLYSCKFLFWVIFISLALPQVIILLEMYNDLNNGDSIIKNAVITYIITYVCFIISLFINIKYLKYITGFIIIILFIYFSSQPELSHYFAFYNMNL